MAVVLDVVSWVLISGGTLFTLTGAVGLIRLPDVFTRMHAAGMTDTMGAGLILIGLCFQGGLTLVPVRLVLVLLFLWFTGPISTHALAKAALHGGVQPFMRDASDRAEGVRP